MVSEITRGVKFRFSTELDPGAAKALEAIEKRVDALQKRMHLTLSVTERGGRGGAGGSGNGSSSLDASAKAAEKAAQARKKLSDARREADERDRVSAEKTARDNADFNQKMLDQQTKDLKKAQAERERMTAQHEKRMEKMQATGWRNLSAIGRESYVGGRKVSAGFDALSEMGRAAMPRDAFAEGLRKMEEAKAMRTGWSGLGANAADTQQRLKNLRDIAKKDDEERKRTLEANKGQLREINSAAYDVVHAFGQLTRAAAQFGLVGQRDMMKVLDTIFAVEGGINALQGGMNAFRAIRSIREARAGMGPGAGAVKYAAGLARLGGAVAGTGGEGTAAAGAGGIGLGTVGLAGAGVTALAAGGIGLLGTIADRRRGVPGQVGGFWDTVGGAINAPVGFVNRGLMGVGSRLERSFNEPYGLTQFQSEERSLRLHESEFNRDFGGEEGANESYYAAKKRADLAEERTQLLERRTQARLGARAGMRDLRGTIYAEVGAREAEQRQLKREFEAQRHGARAANIEARGQNIAGQLGVAFGRQQEFHGELAGLRARQATGEFVDPAQLARAAAEQAREEGLVTSFAQRQRGNLATAQVANLQRGRQLSQDLGAARQRQAGLGEFDTAEKEGAAREILDIEERIKQNAQEREQIAERLRRVEIDGAQRELALRQQSLAAAKQAAEGLRGQRQSAIERFGNLNPMQRRATIQAAQMFKQGIELQEPQLDLLRNFQEVFGPQLRARAEKKFKEEGGAELFKLGGFGQRVAAAEAREKQEIDLSVNARNEIAIKLDANTDAMSKALEERIVPIFKSVMQEAINAIEARLHMARGQDFGQGVERANAAGGP